MPRILTTHTGSLIRPPELAAALVSQLEEDGSRAAYTGPGTFDERLSQGVKDVVRRQAEVGIDIVDDGEISKTGWVHYAYRRLTGIEQRHVKLDEEQYEALLPKNVSREALGQQVGFFTPFQVKDPQNQREGTHWVCTGPIGYDDSALRTDLANLEAALDEVEVTDAFVPSLAPGSISYCSNEYYDTEEEFVFAFADAMRTEYRRIIEAGFLLQVDDAALRSQYEVITLLGGTPEEYYKWADLRVSALNHALDGIPQDRVRLHICSASAQAPHVFDPPLSAVIDPVLRVNAGAYLIEFANARHEHEWHMWEDVELPDDKVLVPGVVTHHTTMVEHPELVADRIVRFANLLGPERVIAGTDCGFQQSAFWERLPEWTQWAKLQALADGARLASERLWGRQADAA